MMDLVLAKCQQVQPTCPLGRDCHESPKFTLGPNQSACLNVMPSGIQEGLPKMEETTTPGVIRLECQGSGKGVCHGQCRGKPGQQCRHGIFSRGLPGYHPLDKLVSIEFITRRVATPVARGPLINSTSEMKELANATAGTLQTKHQKDQFPHLGELRVSVCKERKDGSFR
ncbi:hypothetical protein Tco_1202914 [Tanacetum coccineum]